MAEGYQAIELSGGKYVVIAAATDNTYSADSEETLQAALTAAENGETVQMTDDVTATEYQNVTTGGGAGVAAILMENGGTLDGDGNTLTYTGDGAEDWNYDFAVSSTGGTIQDLNVLGAPYGLGNGCGTMESDLVVNNCYIDEGTYAINIGAGSGKKLIVTGSTLYGWTSYSGLSKASFTDCVFGFGDAADGYLAAYDETEFVDCTFEEGFKMCAKGDGGGAIDSDGEKFTITFRNCTYDGVKLTAANFVELLTFAFDYDGDAENLIQCTIIVDDVTVTDWSARVSA